MWPKVFYFSGDFQSDLRHVGVHSVCLFVFSPQFDNFTVLRHVGVHCLLVFPPRFDNFTVLPHFHTSQLLLFHLLSPSSAPFCFVVLPETFGKEKYNASALSLAQFEQEQSFLLKILTPLEAQLAFLLFRNSSRRLYLKCYSKRPLGHFSLGSGVLCPLTSNLECVYEETLYSAPSTVTPANADGPFSETEKKRWNQCLAASQRFPQAIYKGKSF